MEFTADELAAVIETVEMDTVEYCQWLSTEDGDFGWTEGVSVTGLFRRTYQQVLDTESSEISFTFPSAQMPDAAQNDGIIFNGARYAVREVQVQGHGFTKTLLREV